MKTILIVNHKGKQCGIQQYGRDIYASLKTSKQYNFGYAECGNAYDLKKAVTELSPDAIIYNYYPFTMPWLTKDVTKWYNECVQFSIMHEVTQEDADSADNSMFDYHLCPDPTLVENEICLKTKRLIPPYSNIALIPEVPTIGSFGFGYVGKGFEQIVKTVQDEYDEAHIRFQIPTNDNVGTHIWQKDNPYWTARRCKKLITKPGITLEISNEYLDKTELLHWLAENTINCFFYDVSKYKGISSVIDSALAAHRPIAITGCRMFRHIWKAPICIEDFTLQEIIDRGVNPLFPFYEAWSEKEFVKDYERIMDKVFMVER